MKKLEYLVIVVTVLGFVFLYKNYKKPVVAPIETLPTVPTSTTPTLPIGYIDISKYNTVPDKFSWIEEKNEDFGISFNRPSFWEFQSGTWNNDLGYSASFRRPQVILSTDLDQKQKSDLTDVLFINYYPNIGYKREQLTPEQYLNPDNIPDFAPKNYEELGFGTYRKKIGNINLIKSITPNNEVVGYTFFTKDKVIIFVSYNTSRAEIEVIEKMIASFKLLHTDEEIVTPSNWENFPI